MQRETDQLTREADLFTWYLLKRPADAYLRRKYTEYHASAEGIRMLAEATSFDRFVVQFAARGRLRARLADSYTALFHRESLLRKKLVLMAALLECSPAHYDVMDRPDNAPAAIIALRLGWRAGVFGASAIAGGLLLVPVRWAMVLRSSGRERQPC